MQTVTVEGYLAADALTLHARESGSKRSSFRLLETTRFRRGDGEAGERTTAFNCLDFREKVIEAYLEPYAKKGTRVIVTGHLENDNWTDKDGGKHYDHRLIVSDVSLKARREGGGRGRDRTEDETPARNNVTQFGGGRGQRESFPADLDDEIPF